MNEEALRERVRGLLLTGELPNRRPDRTWGGPGDGAPCAVCQTPSDRMEMEFELEFARDGAGGVSTYHLHTQCYAVWELARQGLTS